MLLHRIRSCVPSVVRFLRDGLVCSGTAWTCVPAQPDDGAIPPAACRPDRREVRRGLAEIERYLATHV
ncbi:hypothetical protein [Nocardioides lianchengensis]|uniref:Uncharacterized protein n=1 Tax=Nocardioides lianchengensis TaxID=1045774 RepID=A0A1G7BP68_9ACTN|nr:hypothetical protein [Nocardioides lianchengensis]NYG08922.1 hypothetical protein [Nocardioides lianchengensis]SDE28753.1 hypothetical protein SAMN05421872_11893 [Nocardioides lianchengensis]